MHAIDLVEQEQELLMKQVEDDINIFSEQGKPQCI
jgi:hypothetical protein